MRCIFDASGYPSALYCEQIYPYNESEANAGKDQGRGDGSSKVELKKSERSKLVGILTPRALRAATVCLLGVST